MSGGGTSPVVAPGPESRFGPRIERADGVDFPFYDGRPVAISTGRWLLVVGSVVVGFAALLLLEMAGLDGPITGFVPPLVFTGLPLLALAYAAGPHWKALFRRVTRRDVATMFGFAGLNLVVTLVLGAVVAATTGAEANPEAGVLEDASGFELAMFYPHTGIQLLGEELLTMLPFLALLTLFVHRGLGRKRSVLLAWVLTAVMFGALHLPTYDWNVVQALLVIGGARIVLTLAYIRTKNLWVSTGAHVINDWVLFTVPVALGALT